MSKSNDAGHFFQTSAALETTSRKEAKAKNKHGNPIKISSKVLAAHTDIFGDSATPTVYVAEAAGEVKRVKLEVSIHNTRSQTAAQSQTDSTDNEIYSDWQT